MIKMATQPFSVFVLFRELNDVILTLWDKYKLSHD